MSATDPPEFQWDDDTIKACLRSMEAAERHPELDADFVWPLPAPVILAGLSPIARADLESHLRAMRAQEQYQQLERIWARQKRLEKSTSWTGLVAALGTAVGMLATIWASVKPHWLGLLIAGAVPICVVLMAVLSYSRLKAWFKRQARSQSNLARISVSGLTGLAALLAGRERGPALRDEWRAHLAGENGHDPVTWAKIGEAVGFVQAGLRDRGQDCADAAWRPVDAVLRSRVLSNLFVIIPTGVDTYIVLRHEGTIGVLTSFESIFIVGAMLYGVIKAGRWYRNIEPPEPRARQTKE